MMNKEIFIENILNGYYREYNNGRALIEIDLDDIQPEHTSAQKEENELRIEFLEKEVNDLRNENALIRTKLLEE